MTTTVFNLGYIDSKDSLIALARHLGLKRDWARVKKGEIAAMLRAFPGERLMEAAKALPEFFDDEDLECLAEIDTNTPEAEVDDAEFAAAGIETESLDAEATPKASPQPQGAQPDVGAVAQAIAALLSAGGINEAKVREIVDPMIAVATHAAKSDVLAQVHDMIEQGLDNLPPRTIEVKSERGTFKMEGAQHKSFEDLLTLCAAKQPDGHRLNVWLYGPPGTGKTTAARNASTALGMAFYCNGALSTKYELTGFVDAHGKLVRTPFRDAWENGGVYLFDEIDGSVPQAIVAFNAALANGVMAFPDGMIDRHPDCVIIAAANTTGTGATSEFTGRMKLDAATLDRFIMLEWAIDEALEKRLTPHKDWAVFVQQFRRRLSDKGIKVQITPRATVYGSSLIEQGVPLDRVKELVLRKGMTADQWAMLA